jgi:hypothetical protein
VALAARLLPGLAKSEHSSRNWPILAKAFLRFAESACASDVSVTLHPPPANEERRLLRANWPILANLLASLFADSLVAVIPKTSTKCPFFPAGDAPLEKNIGQSSVIG